MVMETSDYWPFPYSLFEKEYCPLNRKQHWREGFVLAIQKHISVAMNTQSVRHETQNPVYSWQSVPEAILTEL